MPRQGMACQGKAWLVKARNIKARQGIARQGNTCQGKAWLVKERHVKAREDMSRQGIVRKTGPQSNKIKQMRK